jgi:hypothetical protein
VGAPARCALTRPPYYTCGGQLSHLAGSQGALPGGRAGGGVNLSKFKGPVLLLVAKRKRPYKAALYGISRSATSSRNTPLISDIIYNNH